MTSEVSSRRHATYSIRYDLPSAGLVSLKVFDVLGREVRTLVNEKLQSGSHERTFDARLIGGQASGLTSGVYFYKINARQIPMSRDGQAGNFSASKKLLILR